MKHPPISMKRGICFITAGVLVQAALPGEPIEWRSAILKGPIKAFCSDFKWGPGGPNGFARPGLWAEAEPSEHVAWYEQLGCNVIQTFAVSCNGYAWYKDGVVPEQPGLKHDFLREMVRLGHQKKMLVFGYFCVGANTRWGQEHPELSYGFPSAYHLPFTDDYLDFLCASVQDALRKTGMDGFMIDWVWCPTDAVRKEANGGRWLSAEKRLFEQLLGRPFPGEEHLGAAERLEYERQAIDRCWARIHEAARSVNPECVIWLSCNQVRDPSIANLRLLREADWVMDESGTPAAMKAAAPMFSPRTRQVLCLAGWGEQHKTREVLADPALAAYGIYGFSNPGPDSLPLPVATYLSRSVDSFHGNDRSIAALARFFNGRTLESIAPASGSLVLAGGGSDPANAAAGPWQVVCPLAGFDRFNLVQPELESAVRKAGEVRVEGKCITGAVECDVAVPAAGWYELFAEPEGGQNEFVVDGKLSLFAGDKRKPNPQDRFGKVDNVYLTAGPHTIRLQRYVWYGFWPPAKGIMLRQSDGALPHSVRLEWDHGPGEAIVRKGESLGLSVEVAGLANPATLQVQLLARPSGQVAATAAVTLPVGPALRKVRAAVPCPGGGIFDVRGLVAETPISPQDLKPATVYVIDTAPAERPGGELTKTLAREIDCAATPPDYVHGGETQVITKPFGRYRLSGDVGFLPAQHQGQAESWFAYRIETPEIGRPYILEVDYPDDADRTFLITIRDASDADYPVAGGADTGGPWALSERFQTQSLIFWPKTPNPRVVFMAAHNGRPAAAARLRVFRVDGAFPPLDVPASGGRTFVNWYEEGSNFTGFYGGTKGGVEDYLKSAEMWPRELCYMGGNMLMPTVSVYQMSLFPSRYNHQFAEMTSPDIVRLLLLECEKHGVKLAGEFHPEARELGYPPAPGDAPDTRMVSRTGQRASGSPAFHPLHSRNQRWYLGMIGEFADRYKDSPSFAGVSLRCMSWANPALCNFHGLDWGYDDLAVGLFERDTGTAVPVPPLATDRFAKRYDWLMANAREKWIAWRCEKTTALFRAVVTRVRQARRDLTVYATVFDLGVDAGLDPQLLSRIDGLVLVNCKHPYGRRALTYEGFLADQRYRDALLNPVTLNSLRGPGQPGAFIFGAGYFEAGEQVLKPADIGLPPNTKTTWISGVVNPAGRGYLERYAIALAEADAQMLGDGGNAYTLGQPLLREFLREYRRLPAEPFRPRADARDPVAVWELPRKADFLFYAVNRERYPVTVRVAIQTPGEVRRLATGEFARLTKGELPVELQPFELRAFQAPAGARITRVTTVVGDQDRQQVESMVSTLAQLAADTTAGRKPLNDDGKKLLASAVQEAKQCLAEGRLWRARTLLEDSNLAAAIYNPTLTCPPGLEYLVDPAKAQPLRPDLKLTNY